MKNQPNRDYVSNDVVQTPVRLCRDLVEVLPLFGEVLEPCAGEWHFVQALKEHPAVKEVHECEISRGADFFAWQKPVDWVVTNPPWSQVRPFLKHAMQVANEVVFLMTINHAWTKARLRDVKEAGFALKRIYLVDMPKEFPSSGFQLGALHYSRAWHGPVEIGNLVDTIPF